MLKELIIKNFKLLSDVSIEFSNGLTALTGETGAGKTQCLQALTAVIGERVGDDIIAADSDKSVVTAIFDLSNRRDILDERIIDDGEREIILERTIKRGASSTGRINGRRVPIGTLQMVGEKIVDILGQNARADILNRPSLEILDSFGDETHVKKVGEVREKFNSWKKSVREFEAEKDAVARANERRELAQFQFNELEKADLKPGEYIYSFDDYTLAERKCLEVAWRGRKAVSRVTLEDGRSILSTSDQLMVKVSDPRTNLKWAMRWFSWEPLSEFKVGHMVIAAKASPEGIVQKPLIEDLTEDEEFARFTGFRDSSLAEYAVNPFYDETYTELLNIQALDAEGEAEVYEVSVECDESFVANGFVLL